MRSGMVCRRPDRHSRLSTVLNVAWISCAFSFAVVDVGLKDPGARRKRSPSCALGSEGTDVGATGARCSRACNTMASRRQTLIRSKLMAQ